MNSEATHYHLDISFVFPPPPDIYPFPTTTLLLFHLHHHHHPHHNSVVFYRPPPPFRFYFFFYQTGYLSLAYFGLNLAFKFGPFGQVLACLTF